MAGTIKKTFFTGLAATVPVVITIYVISGLFVFADNILGRLINRILKQYLGYPIPGLGLVIFILLIFGMGLLARVSRMRIIRFMEKMMLGVPLVSVVYSSVKKMVAFIFFPPTQQFKTAVLVEYPRKNIFSLGFVTNDAYEGFNSKTGRKLYNVFVPSTPSPLTGFTIMVEKEELIYLDMNVDNAVKLIISGGLINPQ